MLASQVENPQLNVQDFNFGNSFEEIDQTKIFGLNREIDSLFQDNPSQCNISVNDQGVVLSFSQEAEKIFGCPAEEAIGKNIGEFLFFHQPKKLTDCTILLLNLVKDSEFLASLEICKELGKNGESIFAFNLGITKSSFEKLSLSTLAVQNVEGSILETRVEKILIKTLSKINKELTRGKF